MSQIEEAVEKAKLIDGWMNDVELQWLAEQALDKDAVIEIGAFNGRTTKVLANVVRDKVYVIDPWIGNIYDGSVGKWLFGSQYECLFERTNVYEKFCENLAEETANGKVEVLKMSSEEAIKVLQERRIQADMVFIDGDHDHPVVDNDILGYRQFVKNDGVFCGHDAGHDSYPAIIEVLNKYVYNWQSISGGTIWYVK